MNHPLVAALSFCCLIAVAPTQTPAGNLRPDGPDVAIGPGVSMTSDDLGRPLAIGADWEAEFLPAGPRFLPVLGSAAPALMDLRLAATGLRRGPDRIELTPGNPTVRGTEVSYVRAPGVVERWTARPEGLWHRLEVEAPFGRAGDLVVELTLGGAAAPFGARRPDGSHGFTAAGAGVSYGSLTGFDAGGATVAGDVRLVPGGLELVLPAAFVEAARWPLVFDPLVGSVLQLSNPLPASGATPAERDHASAIAYDASTDRYLLVWQRTLATGATAIRGQLLGAGFLPVGSVLALSAVDTSRGPRVANVDASNRFGVTWVQDFFGQSQVRFRAVNASDGALSTTLFLEGGGLGDIAAADVCGETSTSLGTTAQTWVVWANLAVGVRCARVLVPNNNGAVSVAATTTLVPTSTYPSPRLAAIARAPSDTGRIGVAWFANNAVYASVIDRSAALQYVPTNLSGALAAAPAMLRLDGGGAGPLDYVVGWLAPSATPLQFRIHWASVQAGSTLTKTPAIGGTTAAAHLDIAWRPGKAYVIYQGRPPSSSTWSIHLVGLDPRTCQTCESTTQVATGSDLWPNTWFVLDPCLCLDATTDIASASRGIVVWSRVDYTSLGQGSYSLGQGPLFGRELAAFSPSATTSNQGGACGSAGSILVNSPPAVGNATFSLRLLFPSGSILLALLNLAPPQATLPCGSCQWLPFGNTVVAMPSGNLVTVPVPIPCTPSLAGAQMDSQWTVLKPGTSPCAQLPDFALSDILRLHLH